VSFEQLTSYDIVRNIYKPKHHPFGVVVFVDKAFIPEHFLTHFVCQDDCRVQSLRLLLVMQVFVFVLGG
jgi:hypothetical protein